MFAAKVRSRSPTYFDIDGVHPNIRASKGNKLDRRRIWNYLSKEEWAKLGPWQGDGSEVYVNTYY
jgi:hypothetical protein